MGTNQSIIPYETDGTVQILMWMQMREITHVGIVVQGRLFEYSNVGIEFRSGLSRPFLSEKLGVTYKTLSEIQNWCKEQSKEQFQNNSFDIVDCNCILFAQCLARFLDVPFNQQCYEQLEWCRRHPWLTRIFACFGQLTTNSTSH